MKINDKEINVDDLNKIVNNSFLHDAGNGILLSEEEELTLNKYEINYKNCSINELIFEIEEYLNDSYEELDDLENLSTRLSEFNYYHNTNK